MAALPFSDLSPASHSLLLFLLLFILLPHLHHCDDRFNSATDWTSYRRSLLAAARRSSIANQISNCNALLGPLECNRNLNCRWCRSDAVNDMCFHKTEAWRLPSQVFSCHQTTPSSRSIN